MQRRPSDKPCRWCKVRRPPGFEPCWSKGETERCQFMRRGVEEKSDMEASSE